MKKILLLLAIAASQFCQAQTQFVNDPSFETVDAGGVAWQYSNAYGSGYSMVEATTSAHSGTFVGSLITYPGITGFSYLQQQIFNTTQQYNVKLEFWIRNIQCSGSSTDFFAVTVDTTFDPLNATYKITGLKSDSIDIGTNWKKISINIDTLKATIYYVAILSASIATATDFTIYQIDDITLTTGFPTATENLRKNNIINIYPSIVQDNIKLELNNSAEKYSAHIYNAMGQLMQQNTLSNEARQSLNVSHITAGTYLMQIKNAEGVVMQTERFMKQ
jgi:Secretion system C-terminal sorting domain